MADISKFFLAESGLSLDDDVVIFSSFSDPTSGLGEAAPIGSLLIRTNGELWQKFDTNDVDWRLVSTEGTSVKVSATDTSTGYLNDKLTVTASLIKTVVPNTTSPQTLQLDLSPTGVISGVYTKVTVDSKGRITSASNPNTLSGYNITDAQPLHPNLTALANISAGSPPAGIYTVTGNGTSVARAIVGTTNQIIVTSGDGVSANPIIALADNTIFPGTSGIVVPVGTQAQEVSLVDGTLRYNSTLDKFRFHQAGQWYNLGHDLILYTENPVSPTVPVVTGQNAVAIGEGGLASGQNSIVLGTSEASGPQSVAIGNGALASSYGQVAFSARNSSSIGSSQGSEFLFIGQTITQFPIEIFLDGISQRVSPLSLKTAITFTAQIVAQRVDTYGSFMSMKIEGLIVCDDLGILSISSFKNYLHRTDGSMDADIQINQGAGTFIVSVQGAASTTWKWVVRISTVESVL